MGRLFWKFFCYAWLAQFAAVGVASFTFKKYFIPYHVPGRAPMLETLPMFTAALASLVLAASLAWYFAKPIRGLREAIAAAGGGNLNVDLDSVMGTRRDELADLGRHFQNMAGRLRDVLEGQRRLLNDVSHELRSPVARLQAAAGLARQQPEKLDEYLTRIELEAARIDTLVEELLTLARLRSGIDNELDQEVYLVDVASSVVEDCQFEANLEGGEVKEQIESHSLVRGNPDLLHRAIENVVRNARKHGGRQGAVTVTLREAGDGLAALAVLDNGPGVPEEFLDRIFEPFERPTRAEGAPVSGHGLGLTIARRIVEAHGGTIRASNRPEGGLKVQILLPLVRS